MKKLEERDVPLLERKRVTYLLEHDKQATPSKASIVKEVAKDMKVSDELIRIRHIYPHFGVEKAKIIAHVYKSKEALKRFEEINKKKKKEKKKEEKSTEKKEKPKVEEKKKVEEKPEVKESGEKESKKQESK